MIQFCLLILYILTAYVSISFPTFFRHIAKTNLYYLAIYHVTDGHINEKSAICCEDLVILSQFFLRSVA